MEAVKTEIVCLRLKKSTVDELRRRARMDGVDVEEGLSAVVEELVHRAQGVTG